VDKRGGGGKNSERWVMGRGTVLNVLGFGDKRFLIFLAQRRRGG
jgi:hypothetical protein